MNITITKAEPVPGQHAITDTKTPTRYAVYVDGTLIGHVGTHSRESWDTSGRIRTRMRGYSRSWYGTLATNRAQSYPTYRSADAHGSNRQYAIDRLVQRWKENNA